MDSTHKLSSRKWDALQPVLSGHVSWFHDLLFFLFYPELNTSHREVEKPTSFASWFLSASRDPHYPAEIIEKLNTQHRDLMNHVDAMVAQVLVTSQKPAQPVFNDFMLHYEEFIATIRRLEQDFSYENSGFDPLTGLRNHRLLADDVGRELERLARQGKPFTIAMARVDHFEDVIRNYPPSEYEGYVRLVSDLIKLSLRSFDDAYYMGNGKFVLVLKQSEIKGGFSALERLRRELERRDVVFKVEGMNLPMRMSCCIAEPTENDSIDALVKNLEKDLEASGYKVNDTVLEYFEMSPLQRYMRESGTR